MLKSWKDKRNHLSKLIKKISDKYGGDDSVWLKEYTSDVIIKYTDDLDEAIRCFESIID